VVDRRQSPQCLLCAHGSRSVASAQFSEADINTGDVTPAAMGEKQSVSNPRGWFRGAALNGLLIGPDPRAAWFSREWCGPVL
jgi:hypothetical protein